MLSEEIKKEIDAEIADRRNRRSGCIDALMVVGKHHGWVSDEHVKDVADHLGMTAAEVDTTATFYNHIYRRPVGRHVILVCDSVSCWIVGYEGVRDYLSRRLGIAMGDTTPDGLFTMLPIQCLGVCEQAPAMMIDEQVYTNLDPDKIERILDSHA